MKPMIRRKWSSHIAFLLIEKAIQLTGRVHQAPSGEFRETSQQVTFSMDYSGLPVQDPLRDFTVVIRQNGSDNNLIRNIKPSSVTGGKTCI